MDTPSVAFFDQSAIYIEELKNERDTRKGYSIADSRELHSFLKKYIDQKKAEDVFLYGYNTVKMRKDFISYFKYIQAAGGLVRNRDNKYLFIKRFGIWDLPKGKLKKGEDPVKGAMREVTEETGVVDLEALGELTPTFHIYQLQNKTILKKTYWYNMETTYSQATIPQLEEDILEAVWFSGSEARQVIRQSYRSLAETLYPFIRY